MPEDEGVINPTPGSEGTPPPPADPPVAEDESKKQQIKEALGAEGAPPEKPGTTADPPPKPEEGTGEIKYAGKFKTDKDLEESYLESEKKITQQGQALSSMKSFFETDDDGNIILQDDKPVLISPQTTPPPEDQTPPPEDQFDINKVDPNNPEQLKQAFIKLGVDPESIDNEVLDNPSKAVFLLSAKVAEAKIQQASKENELKSERQKEIDTLSEMVKNEYKEISKNPFFKEHEKEIVAIFDEIPGIATQEDGYKKATQYYISKNLDKFSDKIAEAGIKNILGSLQDIDKSKPPISSSSGSGEPPQSTAAEVAMANKLGLKPEEMAQYKK